MRRWEPIINGYKAQFNRGTFMVIRPADQWDVLYAGQVAHCGQKLSDALDFAEAQAGEKASRDYVIEKETADKLADHFMQFGLGGSSGPTMNFTVPPDAFARSGDPNLDIFRKAAEQARANAAKAQAQANQTAEDAQMNAEIASRGKAAYDAVMTLKKFLYADRTDARVKIDAEAAQAHAEKEVREQWAAKRAKRAADAEAANKTAQQQNKTWAEWVTDQSKKRAEDAAKKAREDEQQRKQQAEQNRTFDEMERMRRILEELLGGNADQFFPGGKTTGTGHRAAPPPPPPPKPPSSEKRKRYWHEVLGFPPHGPYDKDAVKKQYRKLAMTHHPDHPELGGSNEKMAELNEAYEAAKNILGIV